MLVTLVGLLSRSEYLYLPDMRIPPTMLVLQYCQLTLHGLYVGFQHLSIHTFLLKLECKPPNGLLKVNVLDLLQLIETVSDSYGYLGGSIAFIGLEIQIQSDLLHTHFFKELNIHEMWLCPIRPINYDNLIDIYILPEC